MNTPAAPIEPTITMEPLIDLPRPFICPSKICGSDAFKIYFWTSPRSGEQHILAVCRACAKPVRIGTPRRPLETETSTREKTEPLCPPEKTAAEPSGEPQFG